MCIKTSNEEDSLDTPLPPSAVSLHLSCLQENPESGVWWWRCQSVINVSLCPGPGNLACPATQTIIAQTQPPAAYITSINTLYSIQLNTLYTSQYTAQHPVYTAYNFHQDTTQHPVYCVLSTLYSIHETILNISTPPCAAPSLRNAQIEVCSRWR